MHVEAARKDMRSVCHAAEAVDRCMKAQGAAESIGQERQRGKMRPVW